MRKLLVVIFLLLPALLSAQELECRVNLNYSQLSKNISGDRQVFVELEKAISDFMNNQRWTNDPFRPQEKIKCNLTINLLKSEGEYGYSGNAIFQVIRPVYGTSYETVLLNYIDRNFDFVFSPENRQMMFNEQSYTSNLTSMLAFYSLTALAVDYDSFSRYGGNPFIDRLYNLINLIPAAGSSGPWSPQADIRDRYWIMENLRSQQFAGYRESFYKYHRHGLDILTSEPEEARENMIESLKKIQELNAIRPNATLINIFFDAKSEEIVNVFSASSKKEKESIFRLVTSISPDKTEMLRALL